MTLSELFTNIANAIRGKDGTTATITPTDFASRISAIETGVDTSDATATASDMANGVTAYVNGEKITGNVATFQLDPCHIADSIRQSDPYIVMTKSNNPNQLYRAGTGISVVTDKSNFGDATAADVAYGKTFTSSAGLKVTGSLSEVTQAAPGISVSSSGLITASVTQSGGIVTAGTKSATKQLTTQAAKTVTPGAYSQTAVNSGVYTTGAVTVSGDSNLIASNIKNGVSIFGVTGTITPYRDVIVRKSNITISKDSYERTIIKISNEEVTSSTEIEAIELCFQVSGVSDKWYLYRTKGSTTSDSTDGPSLWTYHELYYAGYDTNVNLSCEDGYVVLTCLDGGSLNSAYDELDSNGMLDPNSWRYISGDIIVF